MSYNSIEQLPSNIRRYPEKIQRMWLHVFESTWEKLTKDGTIDGHRESRSTLSANSVLKKNMKKFGYDRYGHAAQMSYFVDLYFKRLPG